MNILRTSVIFLMAALSIGVSELRAATYNFYFNNNEQGNNSVSTPSVIVKDGQVVKTEEKAIPEIEPISREASPETVVQPTPRTSAPFVQTYAEPERYHRWRLVGSLAVGSASRQIAASNSYASSYVSESDSYGNYSSTSYSSSGDTSDPAKAGFQLSLSYFFNHYLGLTLLGGSLLTGAELEFAPLHAGNNLFELGLLAGGASFSELHKDNLGAYLGGRASFNWGAARAWGMTAAFRVGTATKAYNATYGMGELGITVRL